MLRVSQTEPKQEFHLVKKRQLKLNPVGGTISCWLLSHVSRDCPSLLCKATEPYCFAFSEALRRGFQISPAPSPSHRQNTLKFRDSVFLRAAFLEMRCRAQEATSQSMQECLSTCNCVSPPFLQHRIPLSQSRIRADKLNQLPPTVVSFWKAR